MGAWCSSESGKRIEAEAAPPVSTAVVYARESDAAILERNVRLQHAKFHLETQRVMDQYPVGNAIDGKCATWLFQYLGPRWVVADYWDRRVSLNPHWTVLELGLAHNTYVQVKAELARSSA